MNQLQSPFVIPREDVEVLNESEGFCMLRNYLARSSEYVYLITSTPLSRT
jgi:hypothetical protein